MFKKLKPVEVLRDSIGCWMHPTFKDYLEKYWNDVEDFTKEDYDKLCSELNITTKCVYMEYDTNVDWGKWESMMDDSNISDWNPDTPDGYFLVQIGISEDNAIALFAKELGNES